MAERAVAQMASYVIVTSHLTQMSACIVSLLGRVQICTLLCISFSMSSWFMVGLNRNTRAEGADAVIWAEKKFDTRQTSEVGR